LAVVDDDVIRDGRTALRIVNRGDEDPSGKIVADDISHVAPPLPDSIGAFAKAWQIDASVTLVAAPLGRRSAQQKKGQWRC